MNVGPSNAWGVSARDLKAAQRAGYSAAALHWALREAMPLARLQKDGAVDAIERDHAAQLDRAGVGALRTVSAIDPDATEGELRGLAKRRAALMLERIAALTEPVTLDWLNAQVAAMEAREFPPLKFDVCPPTFAEYDQQLQAAVKRACCRYWWTRNVRRAATRKREAREQAEGRVSVRTAVYVGDDTAARYERQQQRNRATLERTELEAATPGQDGKPEIITLWQALEASTSNPQIRRGELMTRIKGAEQWAAARGMVGLFTTNTAPSRFHATHHKGGRNHRYTGDESRPGAGDYGPPQDHSPREAQGWLCRTWARARSALARYRAPRRIGCTVCGRNRAGQTLFGADLHDRGVPFFGFRVAEPHHDGCPHWHMLLFVDKTKAQALQAVMRSYWLADHPDEPGADVHRFKAVPIDPHKGDAAGYIAKYIAKNIDDAGAVGAEGHRDEAGGEQIEIDEAGGSKARRVLAWASAWGIRQFQAIGQPPVTVWRELRRVDASAAQGASPAIKAAHAAVNRDGERLACWRAYIDAQGGAMRGRAARVRLFVERQQREGLYGPTEDERIVGIHDVMRPGEVVLSNRKAWKPRGDWTADMREAATKGDMGGVRDWLFARPKAAQPWTRVNNCTQRGGIAELMGVGIVGAVMKKGPGGLLESDPWTPKPPPPSPNAPPDWPMRQAMRPYSAGSAST